MKILFDCRYVRVDHHDGVSRYSARLVEALARRMPVEMLISDEAQLAQLPDLPWHLVSSPTSLREPWIARQINPLNPDAVFSPLQTMGSAGRRYGLVLTLHDLIYHRHRTPPRNLPWYIRFGWWAYHLTWIPQRKALNRPDEVVTVSETTKALIAEHRLTLRPVTVVRNAADPLGDDPPVRRATPGRDLVYMGSFMPYKNVDTLVKALHDLPGYRLHLLSKVPAAERDRLEALAPTGTLTFHDGVTDAEYAELLETAHALVHASLDEGFGIPLVEAMSVGTPIVVSDIPIFREIGGEAGTYADPRSPAAFAAAVRTLEDSVEWERRSARAREQARLFDWDRSADVLYEVMRRVATKPRPEDAER
ncbi:glycosyltransferase family 4 protein [Pseudolysinimonas yzui]|uniref:Glycosyl transferase n=1 Tax=Pseudolysinimonas yzui TaxID=2708254 RepID=A0A8J3LZA5_9MICO|nr:glycosyltransferase family 1 protein [Pseudolysinimonas yzui]GHF09474.1 glycosyl transferase [Pseudolysinimonas yzui]